MVTRNLLIRGQRLIQNFVMDACSFVKLEDERDKSIRYQEILS